MTIKLLKWALYVIVVQNNLGIVLIQKDTLKQCKKVSVPENQNDRNVTVNNNYKFNYKFNDNWVMKTFHIQSPFTSNNDYRKIERNKQK